MGADGKDMGGHTQTISDVCASDALAYRWFAPQGGEADSGLQEAPKFRGAHPPSVVSYRNRPTDRATVEAGWLLMDLVPYFIQYRLLISLC
ncbi:unnamed protein product, partial [Iphiclides podalirius]